MRLNSEPLRLRHMKLLALRLQVEHSAMRPLLTSEKFYKTLMNWGPGIAIFVDEKIMGVMGIMDFPDGAVLWGTFAHDITECALQVFRFGRDLLKNEWSRPVLCAHINPNFPDGRRLVKCLGFVYDRILPGFTVRGEDRELWVRGI